MSEETDVSVQETTDYAEKLYGADETPKETEQSEETTQSEESSEVVEKSEESSEETSEASQDDSNSETKDDGEESFKLEVPDGSYLSENQINDIKQFAKDNNLDNDQAQLLLEKQDDAVNSFISVAQQNEAKLSDEWHQKTLEDPEIGGDNLAENVEAAKRVVERFGNEEVIRMLNETKYGNHPDLIRFLSKIGRSMSNDTLINPSARAKHSVSMEEKFYGKK